MLKQLSSVLNFTATNDDSSTSSTPQDGHRVTYSREQPPVQWDRLNRDVQMSVLAQFVQDAVGRNNNDAVKITRSLLPLRQVSRSFNKQVMAVVHCEPNLAFAMTESEKSLQALLRSVSVVEINDLPQQLDTFFSQRYHVDISLEDISPLLRGRVLQALANCTHLQTIQMSMRGDDIQCLPALTAVAKANAELNEFSLDVSYTKRGPNDIDLLMALPLTSLYAHCAHLSSADAATLTGHASLRKLYLKGNALGDDACAKVHTSASLELLDLHNNEITDAGVEMISGSRTLQILGLAQNSITKACMPALAGMRLLELTLDENVVGGGMPELAGSRTLQGLSVNRCSLVTDDTHALADCGTLVELHIGWNALPDAALQHVPEMKLKELHAPGNLITSDGLEPIAGHATIEVLDLSENFIDARGAVSLANGLPELRRLVLSNSRNGPIDSSTVRDAFAQRGKPVELHM